MPSFPASFIQEVRSRTSIVSIVGQTVKLKRRGNEYWGCCPFHHEKTASFSVSDEREYYHCFGCGAHGSVFDFVQKTQSVTFLEAVEHLARLAGMEIPRPSAQDYEHERKKTGLTEALEAACLFFEEQLYKPAGRPGLYYLQRRGLNDEIIKRFRLGFSPPGNALKAHLIRAGFNEDVLIEAGLLIRPDNGESPYDYFRNRVMFPIIDLRGNVIAFGGRLLGDGKPKYLNTSDTLVFHKSGSLFALNFAKNEQAYANEYAFDVSYPNGHKTTLIRPSMTSEKMGIPEFVRGPMTGEQTESILAELGYSPEQIKAMEESGAAYQISL